MDTLQERAEQLDVFTGGPVRFFEKIGRSTLITLTQNGLTPQSTLLDVGCGCLRVGYWLIHFLSPGHYYGIEPNKEMLQAGLDCILEPGVQEDKHPRFDDNDQFDFSVFDRQFDYVVARSIWTHASKAQIEVMLDQFKETAAPGAVFLTSYLPSRWRDYRGQSWVGRSHMSDLKGMVRHSPQWVRRACQRRDLTVRRIGGENRQRWLLITSSRD